MDNYNYYNQSNKIDLTIADKKKQEKSPNNQDLDNKLDNIENLFDYDNNHNGNLYNYHMMRNLYGVKNDSELTFNNYPGNNKKRFIKSISEYQDYVIDE